MNWGEVLDSVPGDEVCCVATATTGLSSADGDELLGVAVDGQLRLRRVDRDLLIKSAEYHKVSEDMVLRDGLDDEAFKEWLTEAVRDKVILTYNCRFQFMFLADWIGADAAATALELPRLWKGANMRSPVASQPNRFMYLMALTEKVKTHASFKSVCEQLNLVPFDESILPVEASCHALSRIWNELRELPALITEVPAARRAPRA